MWLFSLNSIVFVGKEGVQWSKGVRPDAISVVSPPFTGSQPSFFTLIIRAKLGVTIHRAQNIYTRNWSSPFLSISMLFSVWECMHPPICYWLQCLQHYGSIPLPFADYNVYNTMVVSPCLLLTTMSTTLWWGPPVNYWLQCLQQFGSIPLPVTGYCVYNTMVVSPCLLLTIMSTTL